MMCCRSLNIHLCISKFHHSAFAIIILLFLVVTCGAQISFDYPAFTANIREIKYHIDAAPSDSVIQLTRNQNDKGMNQSSGRITYTELLHLWDKASGNMADFSTHFAFTINSQNRSEYADGVAFFLASEGFPIPTVQLGAGIGLVGIDQINDSSTNPCVAVEFDTYQNPWDPLHDHVGININSMVSVTNVTWFSRIPEWVEFGISAATGRRFWEIHTIHSWNFNSSIYINPKDVSIPPQSSAHNVNGKKMGKAIVGIVVGGSACGIILIIGLLWCALRKKWYKNNKEEKNNLHKIPYEFENDTGPKKFSYEMLSTATKNFAECEKIGQGGFGGVYKGFLSHLNSYVAVKRVSRGSKQGIKEYASEVRIISRVRHRYLVQLIGWCHEERELLLVYEFMPNGSLDFHLFKENMFLTWIMRYNIARGLASALLYLHEEWEQCVLHRDIKSSNIMLDSNFNCKLGDFGLARFVDHGKETETTVLAGTMGYIAPECVMTGKASKETDVYSFGIVALEIASGRKPINPRAKKGEIVLVEWVWNLYGKDELVKAADPKLSAAFDEKQLKCLMIVGLWCAHPDHTFRPSVRQALQVLNFEAPLPSLASTMPMLTCVTAPLISSSDSPKSSPGDADYRKWPSHYSGSSNVISSNITSSSSVMLSDTN